VTTKVPMGLGEKTVQSLHQRYEKRLEADYPLTTLGEYSADVRDAARRFWSERAWSEYAALPVLSQVLLKLISAKAPLDEIASVTGILQDESFHTAASVRVAEAFGGYVDEVPEGLAFEPFALAQPSSLELAAWLVAGGCVAETVSRALIQARLRKTTNPELRALLSRTLKDENLHVAFTWATAERVVGLVDESRRKEILAMAAPTVEATFRSQCTEGMSGPSAAAERKLRTRVAEAGLGSLTPDEENVVVTRCLNGTIVPRLKRIGLRFT